MLDGNSEEEELACSARSSTRQQRDTDRALWLPGLRHNSRKQIVLYISEKLIQIHRGIHGRTLSERKSQEITNRNKMLANKQPDYHANVPLFTRAERLCDIEI